MRRDITQQLPNGSNVLFPLFNSVAGIVATIQILSLLALYKLSEAGSSFRGGFGLHERCSNRSDFSMLCTRLSYIGQYEVVDSHLNPSKCTVTLDQGHDKSSHFT
jgi:hypothetical protein